MGHIVKLFDLTGPRQSRPPPPAPTEHRRAGGATYGPPSDKWVLLDWHPENPEGWMWSLADIERISGIPEGHLPPTDMVMAPAKRKQAIDIVTTAGGKELNLPNVHFFGRVWPST